MHFRSQATVLICGVEEVKSGWGRSGGPKYSPTCITYALLSAVFRLIAEVIRHTCALFEHKIHNLSLSSDSRQDLQLDPQTIPTVHIEPRYSYKFCLPAHYIILSVKFTSMFGLISPILGTSNFLRMTSFSSLLMIIMMGC